MNILLTGYTGNLGPEIAAQLSGHRTFALVRPGSAAAPHVEGVTPLEGSLTQLPETLRGELDAIIHSAASTAFRAPLAELRSVNVEGTAHLLEFARRCPRLQKFIHLSTTCVCGATGGFIPESFQPEPPEFVNGYEQSKWEAEQLVLASGLPVEIARLSIVAGSERDGSVRRPGAIHHALYWFFRGLIPMVPGHPSALVDLISTEFAAAGVAALLTAKSQPGRIVHIAAGERALSLGQLLETLSALFAQHHRGWATGAIAQPDVVDAETFALFEASVRQSGDVLFQRVCADAQSFLPGLLHPRTLATSLAATLPAPDPRTLIERVFTWLLAHAWERRTPSPAYAHAS